MPRWTVWSLLSSCAALGACVQVLGLEEATLDRATQTGDGPTVVARSRLSCEQEPGDNCGCLEAPGPDCTECLSHCSGGAVAGCTSDDLCRAELDAYAICLGPSCDGDQEDCARELSDPVFGNCVASCAAECERTKLLSPCELYCACMANYCDGELETVGVTDCIATCQDLDEDVRECRHDHCEWGRGDPVHCQHASNRLPKCESQEIRPVGARRFCTDGKESGWACDQNSDCCSDACDDGSCE